MQLLAICISSLEKRLFSSSANFLIILFCVLFCLFVFAALWIFCIFLILTPYKISDFANTFSHSEGRLFILLMVSLAVQKLFSLILPHLFIFAFIAFAVKVFRFLEWVSFHFLWSVLNPRSIQGYWTSLSLSPGTLPGNDPVVPTLASEKTASRAQKLVSGFESHSWNDPFMQDKTSAWRKLPLLLAAIISIHVVTLSQVDLTFQAAVWYIPCSTQNGEEN